MRKEKKTAPRTRNHRAVSSPQRSGLIAKGKHPSQSATTKSALDNRSHRTERDILWIYAITGFLLLPLRKLNPTLLVVLALSVVLVPPLSRAPRYRDFLVRLTNQHNARTEITADSTVLDTYVGEYALGLR